MRILVVSDSHGDTFSLRLAIERQPTARVLIHLGDGEYDVENCKSLLNNMRVIQVRGNCDFGSSLPPSTLEIVDGKRIYCTHGYVEHVKYGSYELIEAARESSADIVLYGHTHTSVNRYEDGLYIFNPGSLHSGEFGIIDITPSGIICIEQKLF